MQSPEQVLHLCWSCTFLLARTLPDLSEQLSKKLLNEYCPNLLMTPLWQTDSKVTTDDFLSPRVHTSV